jgi:hypothetical protein
MGSKHITETPSHVHLVPSGFTAHKGGQKGMLVFAVLANMPAIVSMNAMNLGI